jgi:hypothetical protein
MGDATTLLFGLDGFRVVSVSGKQEVSRDLERHVVVEGLEAEQACPDCGLLSASVHSRRQRRIKDVPHGCRPLRLWLDQRRWPVGSRRLPAVGHSLRAASRSGRVPVALRLREQFERAGFASTRAAADVARVRGVVVVGQHGADRQGGVDDRFRRRACGCSGSMRRRARRCVAAGRARLAPLGRVDDLVRRARPGWAARAGPGPVRCQRPRLACIAQQRDPRWHRGRRGRSVRAVRRRAARRPPARDARGRSLAPAPAGESDAHSGPAAPHAAGPRPPRTPSRWSGI